MRSWVKDKLTNILVPLLQIPSPTKHHYWFALFLDPRYVMELKNIKTFHQSKNIDTKVLFQKMMPKLYEYIMTAELYFRPNTPQILVHNKKDSLYVHNNPNRMHSLSFEATLLERIGAKFSINQNKVAGTEITNDFDVINWFQIQEMQFSILTRFAYIILTVTPSQTEN